MSRKNLEASWQQTRAHLAAGAALVEADGTDPREFERYRDCLGHNELELALDEVEAVADARPRSPQVWMHLRDAAEEMNLASRVVWLTYRIAGATSGYYEALLTLHSTASGGRKHPLATGFRCPWDIGAVHDAEPTLNDATVVLIGAPSLAPGNTGEVRIHPLFPELWGDHLIGRIIRAWDGGFFGEALISSTVPPWEARPR